MTSDDLNIFLYKCSGILGKNFLPNVITTDNRRALRGDHSFFSAYSSSTNFLTRTAGIITDPVCMGILALEIAIHGFINTGKVILKKNERNENWYDFASGLFFSAVLLIFAAVSPLINLVDLIGSGITTACAARDEGDEEESEALTFP